MITAPSAEHVLKPLTITSTGVLSAAGLGLPALAEALNTGILPDTPPPPPDPGDYPEIPLSPVPDPDFALHLGRKGLRNLDRTTKLGLVACRQALHAHDAPAESGTGVVIGTSTGSVRSSAEFCRDTLVHERPYLVNAAAFPNTVMNCCAGQIAIRNSLRGVNATVAGGQLSSLFAFRYARNALVQGQAAKLLVGAVEELSPQTAWGWQHAGRLLPETRVGEGAAVFVVSADAAAPDQGPATAQADLLACEVAYYGAPAQRGRWVQGLTDVIVRALSRSRVRAQEVSAVAPGVSRHTGLRHVELRALAAVLGSLPERQIRVADVLGELFSASGALQLAALLAVWQAEPSTSRRTGLVTSMGPDGNMGCLVVRERA
ncbi:beta-ketoacyl synthase N-terminal-like domain-containing protein [Streptomyces sp. NPDC002668]|uniref:beta-ketoacyl synthase N-terminal-like domain-containing protein n=1 Tax=Streptomyces sp. NPDC002668 TaxID=3154422 RepID=UPI0033240F88